MVVYVWISVPNIMFWGISWTTARKCRNAWSGLDMDRRPQVDDHSVLLEVINRPHLFCSAARRGALLYVSNTQIWRSQGVRTTAPNECRTWGQSPKLFPREPPSANSPRLSFTPSAALTIYWCIFSGTTSCYCCNIAKNSSTINSRMGTRAGPHVEVEIPELSAHPLHCSSSVRPSGLSVALIDSWKLSSL